MTKSGSTDWISVIPFLYTLSGKGLKIYPRDVLKKMSPEGRGVKNTGLCSLQKTRQSTKLWEHQTQTEKNIQFSIYL